MTEAKFGNPSPSKPEAEKVEPETKAVDSTYRQAGSQSSKASLRLGEHNV